MQDSIKIPFHTVFELSPQIHSWFFLQRTCHLGAAWCLDVYDVADACWCDISTQKGIGPLSLSTSLVCDTMRGSNQARHDSHRWHQRVIFTAAPGGRWGDANHPAPSIDEERWICRGPQRQMKLCGSSPVSSNPVRRCKFRPGRCALPTCGIRSRWTWGDIS